MKANDIIVLDNNDKFTLLAETDKDNSKYFLAGKFRENDELDTKQFFIFKEVVEGEEKYIELVNDQKLITELSKKFESSLKD